MNQIAQRLASTRITLVGFVLLALVALASAETVLVPGWIIAIPLSALAANLLAALVVLPRLRANRVLFVMHVSLLALLALAAIGRVFHLEGRVEMLTGTAFEPSALEVVSAGPLHGTGFHDIRFVQQPFSVDYAPGVNRSRTYSTVAVRSEAGAEQRVVREDQPLTLAGYRFYVTHNKGFAPVLTWTPRDGNAVTGAIHMPSYPLLDWKQENTWQLPGHAPAKLWLHVKSPLRADAHWRLESDRTDAVLTVQVRDHHADLRVGESLNLDGGTLRYDELRGWMGYKVFYDPTLPWLVAFASITAMALGAHALSSLGRWRSVVRSGSRAGEVEGTA